ncbi:hypothetical protein [Methanobrevibacter filiformis]|uniref:Uncharacterized protein n=1 Tax=Methanobrevibacter filiformis TaxID=55758 RepID=A0A166FG57_9EURY|nr:hypothetical protein [Methanobrevibacter filiformis]KZX17640.1 hypothetical protein MBFIL_00270 [Methanobrevibacter filiformis]
MMSTSQILTSNLSIRKQEELLNKKLRWYTESRKDRRMKDKISIADNIMNRLNMQGTQREEVTYFIKKECPNLKKLLKNCSKEKIIALVCFFILKSYNSKVKLENYNVFKELKLTDRNYANFMHNLYCCR